ncbi:uncharacterized protein PHACADRAFT_104881 [Phanerochaete carnosa HHB-10118-sp]|uniref:ATP-dependent DNA helicase n=1 Tax=Phanerochaete carnosa (strain HHB-10118-sp) TaxID=650164 RepID=K5VV17_PHACS|nr:uncharacterized protein PHACADRAFT_104881 [Phanerochaete carnosa HHB-10118-sp]EKM50409.1 hypothetical protein PHACADRAFT_104881 [Phanerochaete carnosa HHB-10118-sp]
MCIARNKRDEPFGGINIIVAGDFAQLPPITSGDVLYAGSVTSAPHSANSVHSQKAAAGKALWHQFTTVVILKQNMRQKSQTANDGKLRKCLANMSYGACPDADIKLLNSRIVGRANGRPNLSDPRFHHVSIITSWNAHRDKINEVRSVQFAEEAGKSLQELYSNDKWEADVKESRKKKRGQAHEVNPKRINNEINPFLKETLWSLPHSCSQNHPGVLKLCIGPPVMIKRNLATECCVTNGAEGRVVGWKSKPLDDSGKMQLETVFVELTCPPKPTQLERLPANVVPISQVAVATKCMMPNGKVLTINRDQVPLVPNFAMTDYNSQGKTRPDNVVDLHNCRNHHSV